VEHYINTRPGLSEFSSWSPSLLFVFCFAERLYRLNGNVTSHVCIIDKEKVKNSGWSVPEIFDIGIAASQQRNEILYFEFWSSVWSKDPVLWHASGPRFEIWSFPHARSFKPTWLVG
jgi:hypothetical protein